MSPKTNFKLGFSPLSIFEGISDLSFRGGAKIAASIGSSSLSEALSNARVEPIVLVESSLIHREITKLALTANLDTFTSWYLQMAARLLGTGVDAARVTKVLGQLSTNHDIDSAIQTIAIESQNKIGLPSYSELEELTRTTNLLIEDVLSDVALESDKDNTGERKKFKSKSVSLNKGMVSEAAALAVGKEVTVKVGDISIPILVRLQTKAVNVELLKDIFEANAATLDLSTRLRMFRMEQITAEQLLTGSDIVERYERIAINDKDGEITNMMLDKANNLAYAAITQSIPLNRASGIVVISRNAANDIERTIGGKLRDYKVRQKYFKGTANTMITIIDEDESMVVTYYRGINDRDAKPFSFFERRKEGSADLEPVIKALASGSVPSRY